MKRIVLVILLHAFPCWLGSAAEKEITVLCAGTGVASTLTLVNPEGVETFLASTDGAGKVRLDFNCESSTRIRAKPKARTSYRHKTVDCPALADSLTIEVERTETSIERNLLGNLFTSVDLDKPAIAAFAANELYVYLDDRGSPALADEYRVMTLEQWGEYLDVDNPVVWDMGVDRVVASPDLVQQTSSRQAREGVPQSGKIDFKTLRATTGLTSSDLQYGPLPPQK